jgi:hypothetical protein
MQAPAEITQDARPEDVTVARGPGAVIRGAVALDPEEIPTRVAMIANGQVDPILARPDLLVDHEGRLGPEDRIHPRYVEAALEGAARRSSARRAQTVDEPTQAEFVTAAQRVLEHDPFVGSLRRAENLLAPRKNRRKGS